MIGKETDEINNQLFESRLCRYQIGLEESMKHSDFVFDNIDQWYCKYHKISLNCCRSYIDFPDWIKNKKVTINPRKMMINVFNPL